MSNIPKGYKQTEVGVIPGDWEVKPLKDISSLKGRIGWQGLKETEFTMNADEPFLITGMNFKDGEIRWNEVYHISLERYEIAKEIQLKIDDVLITKDGTIGKLLFISKIPYPGKASLNSHLLVFRPVRNSYMPKFLYYQLASKKFRDYIELNKSGSTFFGISQEAVGGYKAILPSLPEQTAIAAALSDADALIISLEKLITKKRNIKQGAMQELLTGKKRLPGFSGDWKYTALDAIAQNKDYSIVDGPFGSQMKVNEFVSEGIPVIEMEHLEGKQSIGVVTRFITKQKLEVIKRSPTYPDDIIISKTGTLGLLGLVPPNIEKAMITSRLAKISVDHSKANVSFVFYWLQKLKIDGYWEKVSQGGTMQILGIRMLKEAPFPHIDLPEQTAITQVLSDMDAEIEQLEQKLDKFKMIKQGMMQELLTGKTRLI